jgi:Na+-translocating ferredoxin:NAD+ oxidoreductase RnfD subunit
MKAPTWGTVIGVIMIIFGGCSVMNDIKSITLPEILEKQKVIINDAMEETVEEDSLATEQIDSVSTPEKDEIDVVKDPKKLVEDVLTLSEFTKTWIVRFGYIGVVISLLYILGGIFLLTPRKISIPIVYAALILSIAFSGVQTVVLTSDSASGIIALTSGFSQIFSIIIDIILLSVVFASDKEAYTMSGQPRT